MNEDTPTDPVRTDTSICTVQLTADGRDFHCTLHDEVEAGVVQGRNIGASSAKCQAFRRRLQDEMDGLEDIFAAYQRADGMPEGIQRLLVAQSTCLNVHQSLAMVSTAADVQRTLASNEEWTVRAALLTRNPAIHIDLQMELARTSDLTVQRRLASNPSLKPEVQTILAHSKDGEVKTIIASNPSLKPAVQKDILRHGDGFIQRGLAMNPALDPQLQGVILPDHPHWQQTDVKMALAGNPTLLLNIQDRLADDDNERVRASLATNPKVHWTVAKRLAHDRSKTVRYALADAMGYGDEVRQDGRRRPEPAQWDIEW